MNDKYYHSGYVCILGRKYNCPDNILHINCGMFDMSAYVDAVRACLHSKDIDYLVIEPVQVENDLFHQVGYTINDEIF